MTTSSALPDPMTSERDALRHFLASLAFRFRHVTEDAPEGFGDFGAGTGVRTPRELVRHLSGLLRMADDVFTAREQTPLEPLDWPGERARFLALAAEVDARLVAGDPPRADARMDLAQAWRGPLCDAMTHVGQLATLRRLAGAPVATGVRYWQVTMPSASEG